MELTDLEQQRVEKLERLQAKAIEPYPRRVKQTHTIAEAIAAFEAAETTDKEGPAVAVAEQPLGGFEVCEQPSFIYVRYAQII